MKETTFTDFNMNSIDDIHDQKWTHNENCASENESKPQEQQATLNSTKPKLIRRNSSSFFDKPTKENQNSIWEEILKSEEKKTKLTILT